MMQQLLEIEPRRHSAGEARSRSTKARYTGGSMVRSSLSLIVRDGADASRHSESEKIRIDPPAVRTYSTLPAEIQL